MWLVISVSLLLLFKESITVTHIENGNEQGQRLRDVIILPYRLTKARRNSSVVVPNGASDQAVEAPERLLETNAGPDGQTTEETSSGRRGGPKHDPIAVAASPAKQSESRSLSFP